MNQAWLIQRSHICIQVGLGDFFLEPEVFLFRDLLSFPLLFLVGFTLASAFLQKFSELISVLFGKKSVVKELVEQLKKTETPVLVGIQDGIDSAGTRAAAGISHHIVEKMRNWRLGKDHKTSVVGGAAGLEAQHEPVQPGLGRTES